MDVADELREEISDLEFIMDLRRDKPETFGLCEERIRELNEKLKMLSV